MKISRTKIILAAALALAGGLSARAQSNGVPGEKDYAQFSRFITDRNIFDPSRQPHERNPGYVRPPKHNRPHTLGAPYITLVGTMSYEKGLFAFFDSNNSDLKKITVANDAVSNYTVKEITPDMVTMTGPDKKEFQMKVGDQLREESGQWQLFKQNEVANTSAPEAPAAAGSSTESSTTPDAPAPAPSANLQSNDILKRLMEKRAKENQ